MKRKKSSNSFCFHPKTDWHIFLGKCLSIKPTNPKEKSFREVLGTVGAKSYGHRLPLPPKSLKSAPVQKPACFHAVDQHLESTEPPLVGKQAHIGEIEQYQCVV